ncbi:MAG: type II toxin-antitoxin system Phd/YefM family antitoxin [Planctomycetes bacterium]|nr:type II toxin-antitoxin system Phd/YefM family antitoxin [Planctomycetota bacterium]
MDLQNDVCTLHDFAKHSTDVIHDIQCNQRPVMVTEKGKPTVVIIPAELMPDKLKALEAVCELVTS